MYRFFEKYFGGIAIIWVIMLVIGFGLILAPGCKSTKQLQTSKSTLDSSHQVKESTQLATTSDSTAATDKKDSAGKTTWWDWTEQTTTTDHFDPAGRIRTRTTTTKKQGTGARKESQVKTDQSKTSLQKTDSSKQTTESKGQVKKTDQAKALDKKTDSGLPWWIYVLLAVVIIGRILLDRPDIWHWLLAFFRRKKRGTPTMPDHPDMPAPEGSCICLAGRMPVYFPHCKAKRHCWQKPQDKA